MSDVNLQLQSSETDAYQATQYLLRRRVPPALYYKLRTFSRQHPAIFLPFSRWRWNRWRQKYLSDPTLPEPAAPQPLMPDTEIVIEGFPRTANTFAHIAFKMAQSRPVNIAHHTHAAAQVIAGVRRNIPTVVLIREPEAAIISYIIGEFDPEIEMRQVLYDYLAFYQPIIKFRRRFVIAPFQEITQSYDTIIRKVNERYSSDFDEFINTEENVQKCFELIDKGYTNAFGELDEAVVSRPVSSRKSQKSLLTEEFYSPSLSKLREAAQSTYETLMSD